MPDECCCNDGGSLCLVRISVTDTGLNRIRIARSFTRAFSKAFGVQPIGIGRIGATPTH